LNHQTKKQIPSKKRKKKPKSCLDDISNDPTEDPEEETLELRDGGVEEEPVLTSDIVSEDVEKIDSLPEPEKEERRIP
jgi:hypothetical protein